MGSEIVQKGLSMAALRVAAQQTQGILRIPPRLQSAIAAYLDDFPRHELKMNASRLSASLRNAKFVEQQQHSEAPEEILPAQWQARIQPRDQFSWKYKERDTAAYIAARMPAVYSAVHRVLQEVSRRLPDFKPSRILDYGSGPGTAIWALCEIWPSGISRTHLVEHSQAMSYARRSLLQNLKDLLPDVRNFVSLEAFARDLRPNERWHDMVIASYALGEIKSTDERISVVRQLWGFTKNILVIIEPGTSHGSKIVREVRSHILCMEKKKLWRERKKNSTSQGEGTQGVVTESKEETSGAFVVAPCGHDGVCPMDGTKMFCHFSQRLERSSYQRICKKLKGKALRGYEDEKFSFVVLKRGSRPRTEWPLERVDPSTYEENRQRTNFHGVVLIEDPDEEYSDGDGDDEEASEVAEGISGEGGGEEEEWEEEEGEVEYEEEVEVADLGSGWGRIIFSPIRRGKRVLLDVCHSIEQDGSRGMLDRITVSRSNNKDLHFQARRSRWGDLWPSGNLKNPV